MIRASIIGKDASKKFFEQLPPKLALALLQGMRDSAILLQSLMKIKAPVFRGLLRSSIVWQIRQEGNRLIAEVGSALPYAGIVEQGRQEGWFPNIDNLKIWARRKLGDEHLAFVVGRAIKNRGFRTQPYQRPAVEEGFQRIQLIYAARISQAIGEMGGSV